MKTINDYKIEEVNGKWAVTTEGVYQNIDFINGGYILTEQRAVEIRNLMIEQANAPIVVPMSIEEKIEQLENQTAEYFLDIDFRVCNIELGL